MYTRLTTQSWTPQRRGRAAAAAGMLLRARVRADGRKPG